MNLIALKMLVGDRTSYIRVEPYVVPKRSLTGDSTERVDTRVLQVIYSFYKGALPIYVGQQMDVFIEAPPLGTTTAVNAARGSSGQGGVR
jgi:hypothetical protein